VKLATKNTSNVEVEPFSGLLVDYVRQRGARAVIRGLRAISDFEYELQMALINRKLDQGFETVFFMPSEEYSYLTSSIIKEVASLGGALNDFVHPEVATRLRNRFRRTPS
jgi:pantetheine-phosphate adenylyltransferase